MMDGLQGMDLDGLNGAIFSCLNVIDGFDFCECPKYIEADFDQAMEQVKA